MSTQQVTSTNTSTSIATKTIVVGFAVSGYSGITNIYAVVNGNVASYQRVEVEDGQPIQVRLDVPKDAQYVRIIVTDEKDRAYSVDLKTRAVTELKSLPADQPPVKAPVRPGAL